MSTTNTLGLSVSPGDLTGPAAFIAWNWFFAYVVLAPRTPKQIYGIDHNNNPRQDVNKYGSEAVRSGKMTQAQLELVQRVEAASANSTEGYILFTASVLFALVAGVPRDTIMSLCTVYSAARVVYGAAYVFIARHPWTLIRSTVWWVANVSCLYLLWTGATVQRM
ncbi:hypothetical protein H2198_003907 [Neophaeococcomyces mojaviensis]|uniref:Uncharacterized protein n=1 Tax=Neophaeococcomyces mojaviensis TaxID=3383035 RepID=A0ACC3AAH0_9EURO|nr:hypothetical protein H2198_003907 [Knufia sp. JES_112]